jgi:hypothetical protein
MGITSHVAEIVVSPMSRGPPNYRTLESHRSQNSKHDPDGRMCLKRAVCEVSMKSHLDSDQNQSVHGQPQDHLGPSW